MLSFYEIDGNYINYLRTNGEKRIPRIDYKEHKKFFCGIILTINNINYFAPVSSNKNKMYTSFLIKEINKKTKEEKVLSSLRFSFMFPCPMSVLHLKDFNKEDEKYRILLRKELHYCNSNIEKIKKKLTKFINWE